MTDKEKSGYTIIVSFTPEAGTEIIFESRASKRPDVEGTDPIDINTNASGEYFETAPGDQKKLDGASVTTIQDAILELTLRSNMQTPGLLKYTSSYSSVTSTYPNSWIQSVKNGQVDNHGNATTDIEFKHGSGIGNDPTATKPA